MKTQVVSMVFILLFSSLCISAQNKKVKPDINVKKIIKTEKAPGAIGPYNQGIVAGGFLFTSGQLPINLVSGILPSGIEEQTVQVLENLKAIIEAAGSSMEKVVKCTVYLQSMNDFAAMNKIYSTYFPQNPPARVCVEVSKMAKNAMVEMDAVAIE